ncbi:hypothetical protein PV703_11305 [Streptomyces sp. ME01-24h]|nr:hypothetical protein [Streptomyces sp. ME01-24h]
MPLEQSSPVTVERRDACALEQWVVATRTYRRYDNGTLVVERPFTEAEEAWAAAMATDETRRATQIALLERARSDLAVNQTFLDAVMAGTATTDNAITQVAELTRQALGFIRLTVGADLLDQLDHPPVEDPPPETGDPEEPIT